MSETAAEQPAPKPITAGERARDSANFLFGFGAVLIAVGIGIVFLNHVHVVIDASGTTTTKGSATGVSWGEVIAGIGSLMISVPLMAWAVAMGIRIASEVREVAPYVPKPSPWGDGAQV